ncbi:acyltransferase [Microlunatus lacustris]
MSVGSSAGGPQPARRHRLGSRFDPRRNNFDGLRLALALMVVVDHGTVMRTSEHPGTWGRSAIGDFAVDGFFVLSGLLITRSYLKLDSFFRFTWHRVLRIMPGFLVCLVVTALVFAPVAALLTGRTAASAFTESPTAWRYVYGNAALLITQYDIAGLLPDNPTPYVFNGSLWTLSLEALCYGLVGLFGVLAVLRRRRWLVPALAAFLWVLTLLQEAGFEVLIGDDTLRLVVAFLVGATAWLYADQIPMRGWLALLAAVVLLVSIATLDNYRLTGIVPAAYILVWLGTCLPWSVSLDRDLSYGLYIYHWPVLQLLAATTLVTIPVPLFILLGAVLTGILAVVSWHAVEHPALRQKNRTLPPWSPRRSVGAARPAADAPAGTTSASGDLPVSSREPLG